MPEHEPRPAPEALRLPPEGIAAQTAALVPRLETLADRERLPGAEEHDDGQQREFRNDLRTYDRDRYDRLLMAGAHPDLRRVRHLIRERWGRYDLDALQALFDWLGACHGLTVEQAWATTLPELGRLLEEAQPVEKAGRVVGVGGSAPARLTDAIDRLLAACRAYRLAPPLDADLAPVRVAHQVAVALARQAGVDPPGRLETSGLGIYQTHRDPGGPPYYTTITPPSIARWDAYERQLLDLAEAARHLARAAEEAAKALPPTPPTAPKAPTPPPPETPQQGPVLPDKFRWGGREATGLSKDQWRFLEALCDGGPLRDGVSRDEIAARVYVDKPMPQDLRTALKELCKRTQKKLTAGRVRLVIELDNGLYHLTPLLP